MLSVVAVWLWLVAQPPPHVIHGEDSTPMKTVTFTHPTQFTDGSPLALAQITRYEYGYAKGCTNCSACTQWFPSEDEGIELPVNNNFQLRLPTPGCFQIRTIVGSSASSWARVLY